MSGIQTPSPDGRVAFVRVGLDLSLFFSGGRVSYGLESINLTVMEPKRLNRTIEGLKKLEDHSHYYNEVH